MIRDMWVTHGMMRAMCQATKREISESGGRKSMEGKRKEIKRERRREREEGKIEREIKGEREREQGNQQLLPLISSVPTVKVRRAKS